MVKLWLKNIFSLHKNILKPINPDKTLKGIFFLHLINK